MAACLPVYHTTVISPSVGAGFERDVKSHPAINEKVITTSGEVLYACTVMLTPKEVSERRISTLFAQRSEHQKSQGSLTIPLIVGGFFFAPLFVMAAISYAHECSKDAIREEDAKQVRQLELRIEAEQAFDDQHPNELHNEELRNRFVLEHMKAHENDPQYYSGDENSLESCFEYGQKRRYERLNPSQHTRYR
jgi:hypothetical protein